MSGKKASLKYNNNIYKLITKEENVMDLGAFFQTLQYVMMAATFTVLVLVFLYVYVSREEQKSEQ